MRNYRREAGLDRSVLWRDTFIHSQVEEDFTWMDALFWGLLSSIKRHWALTLMLDLKRRYQKKLTVFLRGNLGRLNTLVGEENGIKDVQVVEVVWYFCHNPGGDELRRDFLLVSGLKCKNRFSLIILTAQFSGLVPSQQFQHSSATMKNWMRVCGSKRAFSLHPTQPTPSPSEQTPAAWLGRHGGVHEQPSSAGARRLLSLE